MIIKVVDYRTGNISSVVSALEMLGVESTVVSSSDELSPKDFVILPGVGSFDTAAKNLEKGGFFEYDFSQHRNRVIGICLGYHLMCTGSEEGVLKGLGLFNTRVKDFKSRVEPILNLGWSNVESLDVSFSGKHYFCHRYFVEVDSFCLASVNRNGQMVSNVMNKGSFWGVQSHPERSGYAGLQLLERILNDES